MVKFNGKIAEIAVGDIIYTAGAAKIDPRASWGHKIGSCGMCFRGPKKNFWPETAQKRRFG